MPTIPDSNIILDLLERDPEWFEWSAKWLSKCATDDQLVVNSVVLAEATAKLDNIADVRTMIRDFAVTYESISFEAAHVAGKCHYVYRNLGGRRERVLPDFLIGAHASVNGYAILTRDQARYRTYFPSVKVIAPDTHP